MAALEPIRGLHFALDSEVLLLDFVVGLLDAVVHVVGSGGQFGRVHRLHVDESVVVVVGVTGRGGGVFF